MPSTGATLLAFSIVFNLGALPLVLTYDAPTGRAECPDGSKYLHVGNRPYYGLNETRAWEVVGWEEIVTCRYPGELPRCLEWGRWDVECPPGGVDG